MREARRHSGAPGKKVSTLDLLDPKAAATSLMR
jgi:hypothetical protein